MLHSHDGAEPRPSLREPEGDARRLRAVRVLAVGLALAALLAVAGCAGDDGKPVVAATAGNATPSAAATFELSAPVPSDACGASGPGWPEGSEVADYEAYEGLSFEQAEELAARSGHVLLVLGQDGVCAEGPFTADLRSDRVNLYLDSERVIAAYAG